MEVDHPAFDPGDMLFARLNGMPSQSGEVLLLYWARGEIADAGGVAQIYAADAR
jgi:hypothetical protein